MTGLQSPWGNRGEICKNYGFTYDYLLWGISWINISLMMADALRVKDEPVDGEETDLSGDVNRTIKTKEEIENYINSVM